MRIQKDAKECSETSCLINFVTDLGNFDIAYDRFLKTHKSNEFMEAYLYKGKDINHKFLRSLPPLWSQIALIMRNKPDIDEIDIDDLYNNLRVYEDEMKKLVLSMGDLGFCDAVEINQVPSTSNQMDEDDLEKLDLRWHVVMLTVRVKKFIQRIGRNMDFKEKQLVSLDSHRLSMVAQDGLGGYGWCNNFNSRNSSNYALMVILLFKLIKFFDCEVVKERDELKIKIAKWEDSTKNLDEILNSQMSARDKSSLGYSTQLNELSEHHEMIMGLKLSTLPLQDLLQTQELTSFILKGWSYTKPAFRPKDLKQDVKTFGVKNMTTAGTRAVVNTGKGKMVTDLKKSRWVWRPKGEYLDHVGPKTVDHSAQEGGGNSRDCVTMNHAVVDCDKPLKKNKRRIGISKVQTRGKIDKASSVQQALAEAMQEELLQFKLQQVWILVDLPFSKKAIGTKWVFRNKRDERSIVVKNKAKLIAQGVLALYGLLQRHLEDYIWQCKKQTIVANSTTKAEYVAAAHCCGQYSDKHNMVAFLKKPNESVGFTEVVDFLKGSSLSPKSGGWDQFGSIVATALICLSSNRVKASAQMNPSQTVNPSPPHHLHSSITSSSSPTSSITNSSFPPLHHSHLLTTSFTTYSPPLYHHIYVILKQPFPERINSLEKELKDTKQTLGTQYFKFKSYKLLNFNILVDY
ncbi:ribonuclease H-like domain-containing protein [Tanacetum coccineum]|uniref:Ribonuclease H-like domain-containing protein n=1 Tax=Tanacetum coccineum TaxID=301880 RepID=A0ABQ5J2S1_9ASTR